jgi:xanthine/uracil permease
MAAARSSETQNIRPEDLPTRELQNLYIIAVSLLFGLGANSFGAKG